MKSTYKLLGAFWDRMETPKPFETFEDWKTNRIDKVTCISFKDLLSVQNEDDFKRLVAHIPVNREAVIMIDFDIDAQNPVLHSFLKKRLSQMLCHLRKRYPGICCIRA